MLIEEGRCFVVDYPSDFEASLAALETNVVIGFSPDLEREVGRFPPPVEGATARDDQDCSI
jgi:hypothetical protein